MRVSFGVHIAIFPSLLPDPLSMYRFSALQRERTASSCARSVLKAFLESELIMYIRPSLDPAQICVEKEIHCNRLININIYIYRPIYMKRLPVHFSIHVGTYNLIKSILLIWPTFGLPICY